MTFPGENTPQVLRDLAADPVFARREDELLSLADAVASDGEDFAGWDHIDLHAAFPAASTISIEPEQGRETLLGALAGASVFLPIIWTWWSLMAAAEAFNVLLADGRADGQSFIQLWVSGFDGELAPIHHLTTVTLVSVLLILLAIALFVLHRVFSDRSLHRQDAAFADAEARLSSALTQARRAMSASVLSDSHSAESIIRASLEELARAHAATELAATELSRSARLSQEALAESGQRIESVTAVLSSSTAALERAAKSVDAAATSTRTETAASLDEFGRSLTALVEEYQSRNATDLREARDSIAGATEALKSSRASFEQTHRDAVQQVETIGRRSQEMQTGVQESFGQSLDSVRHVVGQLESANEGLVDALARLEPALAGNQSALQAQVTELTNTRDALVRLSREGARL